MFEKDLAKETLSFQIAKHITIMFKNQLEMLDFMAAEQGMDEQTKQRYRKLFLATGNDAIRVLKNELDKVDIQFKN